MSLTQQLFNFIVHVMQTLGYAGIFGLMVLESATLPVPSEIVLPFAGYLVFLGTFNFVEVLIVASIGSLVGTMIDYFVGDYLGRAVILRYGRFIHLNEKHLASSESWFKKYGDYAVLFARFVPLIRTLVAFPAGIAKMKMKSFIAFSMLGIVIYDAALIYLGYIVGPSVNSIINSLSSDYTVAEIIALIVAIVVLYAWFRRNLQKKSSEGSSDKKGESGLSVRLYVKRNEPIPSMLSLFPSF